MTPMTYDVASVRARFPALREGAAHFDGAGGSQVPDAVAEAVATTLTSAIANRGTITTAERRAEEIVLACRAAIADMVGSEPRGVVFGRSMTQLTYDISRAMSKTWHAGDEVVVTRLDHDANIRPWVQAAQWAGAIVRWIDVDPRTGDLAVDDLESILTERTRLVAVTAASNLIGTRPDVRLVADAAHAMGAQVYVDAVHAAAHVSLDYHELGADFVALSPYKFFGPHCGAVVATKPLLKALRPDKLAPSTNSVPERFELGTLPYELMAGTTAAVDFIAGLAGPGDRSDRRARLTAAMELVDEHEKSLSRRLEAGLRDLGATIYSRAARRTPTTLFRLPDVSDDAVRAHLASRNVNAPSGSFYALELSRSLDLGDHGAVRASIAPYTNDEDVDRLLDAVREIA